MDQAARKCSRTVDLNSNLGFLDGAPELPRGFFQAIREWRYTSNIRNETMYIRIDSRFAEDLATLI